jgi:16S rRNA (guanine527-N7)-methyltransferase
VNARVTQALAAHRALLDRWRGAMDLIGPGPAEPHFEDAIGVVSGLDASGDWADLGSGAGFPGVALAAFFADARVVLAESRQKRATFLKRVVYAAGLENASVHHGRTEALEDGAYDGVISRAYKPPLDFLVDAARLLKPGGRVVLMLGSEAEIELPVDFEKLSSSCYIVGDGQRQRVVLRRG